MVTINYLREENRARRAEMAAMKPSRGEAAILLSAASFSSPFSRAKPLAFARASEWTVPLIAIRRVGARENYFDSGAVYWNRDNVRSADRRDEILTRMGPARYPVAAARVICRRAGNRGNLC